MSSTEIVKIIFFSTTADFHDDGGESVNLFVLSSYPCNLVLELD